MGQAWPAGGGLARWTDWARPGQLEGGWHGGQNGPGLEECADSGHIRQGPEERLDSGQNERGLEERCPARGALAACLHPQPRASQIVGHFSDWPPLHCTALHCSTVVHCTVLDYTGMYSNSSECTILQYGLSLYLRDEVRCQDGNLSFLYIWELDPMLLTL